MRFPEPRWKRQHLPQAEKTKQQMRQTRVVVRLAAFVS
jgi:hypothetical protein